MAITSISVAMATFNGSRHLEEQLASLEIQSLPPSEVVICDDGSTDDTMRIVNCFAKRVPFDVRIIANTSQLGYRSNFMKCASLCTGDLIAFCDQDDIWHPDKLKTVVRVLKEGKYLLVQHGFELIDSKGEKIIRAGYEVNKELTPWSDVLGLTQVFKRDLLSISMNYQISVDQNDYSHLMAHDQWVYFLAQSLGQACNINNNLVMYRQHTANVAGINALGRRPSGALVRNIRTVASAIIRKDPFVEKRKALLRAMMSRCQSTSSRLLILDELIQKFPAATNLVEISDFYRKYKDFIEARIGFYVGTNIVSLPKTLMIVSRGYRRFSSDRPGRDLLFDMTYGLLGKLVS